MYVSITLLFWQKVHDALAANIYLSIVIMVWMVFMGNKKDTSKTRVNCCSTLVRFEQTLHLVWVLLWPICEKQINVCCGIGSVSMSITSHIYNAANRSIAKNSCQSYIKKIEDLFYRKQEGVIGTGRKIYFCILFLCIVVTIFHVATSLSIFSTGRPSLA